MKFSEDVEQILDTHAASGPGSVRPTRQQIIEEAVRMWAVIGKQPREGLRELFGAIPDDSIDAKVDRFVKAAGPVFEGVDLKMYMDEVRER